ncbi:hypothetical protein ACWCWD_29435 [Streptomyces sp. NPDC001493]
MASRSRSYRKDVRTRNLSGGVWALLAASTAVTLSACSSGPAPDGAKPLSDPPASSATAEPSLPADPAETAGTQAVRTYTAYWEQMERGYAKGSSKGTRLTDYAAGAALVNADHDIANLAGTGQILVGEVTVDSPTVTSADLSGKIPNVKLTSCLDVSSWKAVDRKTGKEVTLPADRLTKYIVLSVVEKWPEGWRVIKDEPQEKAC